MSVILYELNKTASAIHRPLVPTAKKQPIIKPQVLSSIKQNKPKRSFLSPGLKQDVKKTATHLGKAGLYTGKAIGHTAAATFYGAKTAARLATTKPGIAAITGYGLYRYLTKDNDEELQQMRNILKGVEYPIDAF